MKDPPRALGDRLLQRGILGEVQLSGLLDQVFTIDQYATNVETVPSSGGRVEFAIKLPGRREDNAPLWLPIDCKFPLADWQRLQDALEHADVPAAEATAAWVRACREAGCPERVEAVTVPVLIVQGESDPFGMPPDAPPLREVVKLRGNHSLSSDAEGLRSAVREWLTRVV